MPLDPSIISGLRPVQIDMAQFSPMNALAAAAKFKQADQENALNAQKLAEYERARIEEQDFRNYLATTENPSAPDARQNLLRYGKLGAAYSEALGKQETATLTQSKTKFELEKAKRELRAQAFRDTSQNPSDANITAYKEDFLASPLFDAAEKAQMAAGVDRLLAMPVNQRTAFMASQGASASELKPTTSVAPTGIVQTPAFGGPATVVSGTDAAFQMTPAQIAQNERDQKRLGFEGQRVGLEGQRVGLERERVNLARAEAERKTQGMEALPPKEIQKREAVFPQATAAIKSFDAKSTAFVKDLERLRDHPGLSQITGIAAGRLPGITADGRAAQALYDKVVAKGGFQALQDMRDASKTGGALGNVSNQEGKQLTASFAAIDRKQDAPDVKEAINQAIGSIEGAKVRMQEAYDSTYSYKGDKAPAAPSLSPIDQQALQWANSNPTDPRAAAIKQRLGK